jgi:hypothetical protein
VETLTDFLKDATFLTLLTLLTTVISILVGIAVLVLARTRRPMYVIIAAATLPLLAGLLTMYVDNRQLDSGYGMFGRLSAEAIAAGRRDALITGCIGAAGAVLTGLIGIVGLKLKRNRGVSAGQP